MKSNLNPEINYNDLLVKIIQNITEIDLNSIKQNKKRFFSYINYFDSKIYEIKLQSKEKLHQIFHIVYIGQIYFHFYILNHCISDDSIIRFTVLQRVKKGERYVSSSSDICSTKSVCVSYSRSAARYCMREYSQTVCRLFFGHPLPVPQIHPLPAVPYGRSHRLRIGSGSCF